MSKIEKHRNRAELHLGAMLELLGLMKDSIQNLFVCQDAEVCRLETAALADLIRRYREQRACFERHALEVAYYDPSMGRELILTAQVSADKEHLQVCDAFPKLLRIYHERRALS